MSPDVSFSFSVYRFGISKHRERKFLCLNSFFVVSVVVCCSVDKSCLTLRPQWTAACQASLSFTISWSLLRFMSAELMMPSNHFVLCRPLFLLPSIFPSIRVFSNELALCIRWPKYWSFSFVVSKTGKGVIFTPLE